MNQNEVYYLFVAKRILDENLYTSSARIAEELNRPGARRQVLKLYASGFLEVIFVKNNGGGFEPRYRLKKKEAKI
jgi:hypothetical protein